MLASMRVAQVGAQPRSSCCVRLPSPAQRCRIAARAVKEDVLLRSISDMGEIAVLVVDGTQLVAEAAQRHKTAPTATAALGRALLGSLLMACFRKDDEALQFWDDLMDGRDAVKSVLCACQVSFRGDGPIGGIMVIADSKGNVKGKVGNPSADPPLREDNKLNVGAAVGQGVLAIVRSRLAEPRPYTGIVPIISGEVAEDLANYLVDSEQTNSALGLGVSINRDCSVKSAGGFLVQVLPFCSEETLEQLEKNLTSLPSVTNMLNQGMTTQDITEKILEGLGVSPGGMTIKPKFGPCETEPLRKRMLNAVASLGAQEVKDIVADQGKVEVTCEFCNERFQFQEEQVMAVIQGN